MCGVFGFALKEQVSLSKVFKLLERLEAHQYLEELKPVGGFGAGVAVLEKGDVLFEKVGKVGDASPVRRLAEIFGIEDASILVGHVRMPSPEFMSSARFRETAQPYVVQHDLGQVVVSVHNGKVENYKELRAGLGDACIFESDRVGLIDSEVVPHLFARLLDEKQDNEKALDALFDSLKGSNAIALLQVDEENAFMHFVHMGATRGLSIWTNDGGELIFCSRIEPLKEVFGDILNEGGFREHVCIRWQEKKNLKLSFCIR